MSINLICMKWINNFFIFFLCLFLLAFIYALVLVSKKEKVKTKAQEVSSGKKYTHSKSQATIYSTPFNEGFEKSLK